MKKILLFVFLLLGVLSCKKKEADETKQSGQEKPAVVLNKGCYAFDGQGNAIVLKITETSNGIKGYLKYDLYEKDSNTGTFEGILKNDTLAATYTFQSEGVQSTREVAFLVKGNQLLEGYGEMTNDGTKFKNHKAIRFNKDMPLTKTDCKRTAGF